ncbi:uncharacterized protein PFB0765w-like [Copidosoma floridanum]|uniref:uncharacterized protein PFB0765w-like n=1 Tax=Copidosoma floridanum TaxID=29053 RepID=UPI000C6F782B|nr:uncharacterized protein PFB0765w-like [Copidosoma floridanum]
MNNDECFQWIHVEKKGLKEYKDEDYLIESPKSDTRFSEPISSTFADISKKSDKAKKEIVSKKLPSNVKRNLATELDTASSKFLTEEEDESSDEFIPRDFQAQSTKIFSDTLSENIHNRRSLALKPPLDVPKELNQPKDSGIDEDVADDNAKYKTVDKKLKSTENKIDNNQPKREIIGRDGPIKVPKKTNVFEVAGKSLYDLVDEKSESYKNNDEKYTKSLNAVNKKSSIQDNSDESYGLHNFEKISSDKDKTTKNQCLKNMEKLQQFKKMLAESKSPLLQQQYDTLVQNKLIKENSTKGSESDSNMNAESFQKSEKLTQVLKTQSKKVKRNKISASDNISTSENSDEKHGRDEVGDHHTQVDVDSMSPKTRINKEMNFHPKELIVSEKNSLIHKTHVTDDSSNDSIDNDHNNVSLKTIENLQKAKKLNLWDISESEIGKRISRESSVSDISKISDANKNGDDSDIEQHANCLPILCGISSNNPAKETVVVANGFSQDINLNNFIDKSDENDDEKNYEKEFINKDSVKPSSSRNGCMNGNNYVSTSESKKLLQHENSSSSDDGIRPNKAKEDEKKRAMHDLQSQKSNVSTINNGRSRSLDKSVLTQKSVDKSDSDSDSDLSNVSKSKIPVPLATSTQVHKSPTKQKLEHCAGKHDTKRNDCIVNSKNSYEQRGEIDIMEKSDNEKSPMNDSRSKEHSSSKKSNECKIKEKITPDKKQRYDSYSDSDESDTPKSKTPEQMNQSVGMDVTKKLDDTSDSDSDSDKSKSTCASKRLSQYRNLSLLDKSLSSNEDYEDDKKQTVHDAESDDSSVSKSSNASKTSEKNTSKIQPHFSDSSSDKSFILTLSKSNNPIQDTSTQSKPSKSPVKKTSEQSRESLTLNDKDSRKQSGITDSIKEIQNIESEEMFPSSEKISLTEKRNGVNKASTAASESGKSSETEDEEIPLNQEQLKRKKITKISELVERDHLSEGICTSTVSLQDFSSDDHEIFLLDVPKYKYASPTLSCLFKTSDKSKTAFKAFNIRPVASIVARRKKSSVNEDQDVTIETSKLSLNENDLENNKCTTDVSRLMKSPSVTKAKISKKHSKEVLSVAEEKNNENVDDSSSSESQTSLLNDVSRHTSPSVTKAKISKKHSKEVLSVAEEKNNENVDDSSSSESQTSLLNNNVDPKDDECMARNVNHQNSVLKQSEISGKSYEQVISAIEKEHHENDSQVSDGRTKSYLSFDVNGNSKNSHHSELELKGRKSITKLEIFGESNKQKIFNAIEEACNKNEVLKITVVIEKIEKSKESSKENIIEFDQEKNDKIESTTETSKILKLSQSNKKPIMNSKVTKTVQKSKHLKNKFAISNFTKKKLPKKKINLALENNLVEIPAEKETKVNEEKTKVHSSETKPKEIEEHSKKKNTDLPSKSNLVLTSPVSKNPKVEENKLKGNLSDSEQDKIGFRTTDTVTETINAVSVVKNNMLNSSDSIADFNEEKEEKVEVMKETETNIHGKEKTKKKSQKKLFNLHKENQELVELTADNVKLDKKKEKKNLKLENLKSRDNDGSSVNNDGSSETKKRLQQKKKLSLLTNDSENGHSDSEKNRCVDSDKREKKAKNSEKKLELKNIESSEEEHAKSNEDVQNLITKRKSKKNLTTDNNKASNVHENIRDSDTNTKKHEINVPDENAKFNLIKKSKEKTLSLRPHHPIQNLPSSDDDANVPLKTVECLQKVKKLNLLDSSDSHDDQHNVEKKKVDKKKRKKKEKTEKTELNRETPIDIQESKNRKNDENPSAVNSVASNGQENTCDSDIDIKEHKIYLPEECKSLDLMKSYEEETLKPVEENKSKSKKHTSKKSNEVTEKEKNRCILNTSSESEVVAKKLSKKKSKSKQLKHVSFDIKSDDESDEKSMVIELDNPSMKTASNNINEDTSDHFMSVTAAQKLSKLKKLNLIDASSSSSEDEKYDRKSRTNDIVYNSKKSNVPNKNTLVQKQMPESSTEKKKLSSKCTSSLNIHVNDTKKSRKTEKIQELVDRLDEDDAKLKRKKEKKKSSSTKNNVDSDTIVSNVQKKEEIQLVAEVINVDDFKIEKKKRKKKSRHDLDSAAISNEHEENRVEERENVVDESNEDYVKVEKKKEKKKKAVDVNCDDKKLKRKREAEEEPVVEKKKLKKAKTNSEEKFESKVEVDEPELVTFEVPCKKEKSKSNSEEAIEAPTPKKKKKAKTTCIDLEDEIKPSAKNVNEESTKTKEKQKKPAKTKKSSGDNVNQGSLGAEAAKPCRRLLALYESSSSDEYHKSSIKRAMDPDKEPKLESDSSDRKKKKKKKKKHKSFHFDE